MIKIKKRGIKYEKCLIPEHLLEYMDESINYDFVGRNGKTYKEPGNDEWNKDWHNEYIVQNSESLIKKSLWNLLGSS